MTTHDDRPEFEEMKRRRSQALGADTTAFIRSQRPAALLLPCSIISPTHNQPLPVQEAAASALAALPD